MIDEGELGGDDEDEMNIDEIGKCCIVVACHGG
jgi:hypothetical protein